MKAATISTTGNEATAWHALAVDDVVRRLNTSTEKGLDAATISQRRTKYGPNRLPEAAKRGLIVRFLMHFNNVLVYVLLAAGFMNLWLEAAYVTVVDTGVRSALRFPVWGRGRRCSVRLTTPTSRDEQRGQITMSGCVPVIDPPF